MMLAVCVNHVPSYSYSVFLFLARRAGLMGCVCVYTVTDKWQLELEMKVHTKVCNHGEGPF